MKIYENAIREIERLKNIYGSNKDNENDVKLEIILNNVEGDILNTYYDINKYIDIETFNRKCNKNNTSSLGHIINNWDTPMVELNIEDYERQNQLCLNTDYIFNNDEYKDKKYNIIRKFVTKSEIENINHEKVFKNNEVVMIKDLYGISKFNESFPTLHIIIKNKYEIKIRIHASEYNKIKNSNDLADLIYYLAYSLANNSKIENLERFKSLSLNAQYRKNNDFISYLDQLQTLETLNSFIAQAHQPEVQQPQEAKINDQQPIFNTQPQEPMMNGQQFPQQMMFNMQPQQEPINNMVNEQQQLEVTQNFINNVRGTLMNSLPNIVSNIVNDCAAKFENSGIDVNSIKQMFMNEIMSDPEIQQAQNFQPVM